MKLSQKTQTLVKSDDFEKAKFEIDSENVGIIIHILRDQLYSDKLLAPIREYSTNAIDAHVASGIKDKPITITLPTFADPQWKVRDYGEGLDHEEVSELYVKYGASTKRTSNDYTGMLGIGCKSGFAYANTFMVTTWKDGTKCIYSAALDENNNGFIHLMDKQSCNGEQGVEIAIPVQGDDIDAFNEKTQSIIRCFDITPELINGEVKSPKEILMTGDGWRLYKHERRYGYGYHNSDDCHAVMGNIPYPIKADSMHSLPQHIKDILDSAEMDIDFPLGQLDIAASRESLEYTTKTTEAIETRLDDIVREMLNEAKNKVNGYNTLWEVKANFDDITNSLPSEIRSIVRKKGVDYRSKKLATEFNVRDNGFTLREQNKNNTQHSTTHADRSINHYGRLYTYERGHRSGSIYRNKSEQIQNIAITEHVWLCHHDSTIISSPSAVRRIRNLQTQLSDEDLKTRCYLLLDYRDNKSFYDSIGMTDVPSNRIVDLTTVEPLKATYTPREKKDDEDKSTMTHISQSAPIYNFGNRYHHDWTGMSAGLVNDNLDAGKTILYINLNNKSHYGVTRNKAFAKLSVRDLRQHYRSIQELFPEIKAHGDDNPLLGLGATISKTFFKNEQVVHLQDWLDNNILKYIKAMTDEDYSNLLTFIHDATHERSKLEQELSSASRWMKDSTHSLALKYYQGACLLQTLSLQHFWTVIEYKRHQGGYPECGSVRESMTEFAKRLLRWLQKIRKAKYVKLDMTKTAKRFDARFPLFRHVQRHNMNDEILTKYLS